MFCTKNSIPYYSEQEIIVMDMIPRGWKNLPWLALPDWDGKLSYAAAMCEVDGVDRERWPDRGPEWANWSEATRRHLCQLLVTRGDPWKAVRALADQQRQWCRDAGAPIPP